MRFKLRRAATGLLEFLLFEFSGAALSAADEPRFDPARDFPPGGLARLSIRSLGELGAGLRGTLLGRIASHPGTRAALGKLPEFILEKFEEGTGFQKTTGVDPLTFLSLLRGGLEAVLAGIGDDGIPQLYLALEVGDGREAILGAFEKFDAALAASRGEPVSSVTFEGSGIVLWPSTGGPDFGRALLGRHLVFAVPADLLRPVIHSFAARSKGEKPPAPSGAGASANFAELEKRAAFPGALGQVLVDVKGIRGRLEPRSGAAPRDRPEGVEAAWLRILGLENVSAAGLSFGFGEGELEFRLRLETPGGLKGLLGSIAASFEALDGPGSKVEELLARLPAGEGITGALRCRPFRLAQEVDRWREDLERTLEKEGLPIVELMRNLRASTEVWKKPELRDLPPLDIVFAQRDTPAGGFLRGSVALFSSNTFAPYAEAFRKRAVEENGQVRVIEEGGFRIESTAMGAWVELGDGRTLWSGSAAEVRRHLPGFTRGAKLGADPNALRRISDVIHGARLALTLGDARTTLASWNTIVSAAHIAAMFFEGLVDQFGLDPGLLPAGEEFLAAAREGFIRFEADEGGLGFHGRGVVTGSGAVSSIAGLGILAGFAVPTLMSARTQAGMVRCKNYLREIAKFCLLYAQSSGKNQLPHSPRGGIASLQILAEAYHDSINPVLFICASSKETAAPVGPDGNFKLDANHCSYEMVPWQLSSDDPPDAILIFDRHPHSNGQRNVAYLDSSVSHLTEADFQQKLERDRQRFGGKGDGKSRK